MSHMPFATHLTCMSHLKKWAPPKCVSFQGSPPDTLFLQRICNAFAMQSRAKVEKSAPRAGCPTSALECRELAFPDSANCAASHPPCTVQCQLARHQLPRQSWTWTLS